MDEPTVDSDIVIERREPELIRYRRSDGSRWEVLGICDHNRACMVGAVVDGHVIRTVEEAQALPAPKLDCPVTPGFTGCCPLEIRVL
jgi:hypothetical protein